MKKIIVIFLVLVVFFFTKKENKIDYVKEANEKKETFIFLENKKREIVGVKHPRLLDDDIYDVFNYLTCSNSKLEIGYRNYMTYSTKLNSYEIIDTTLILNMSDDFNRCQNNIVLKQIYYSFLFKGFKKIEILIDGEKLESINGENVKNGLFMPLVNPVYDFNSTSFINIYYALSNNLIMPVSYAVRKEVKKENFIIEKLKEIDIDVDYQNNNLTIGKKGIEIIESTNHQLLELTIYYTITM